MGLEDKVTFSYRKLQLCSFDFFVDMKKKRNFCDLTFNAGDQLISAHRIIVAAAIPYIQQILLNNETENKNEVFLTIPEVDPEAFQVLIDFAYTGEIEICVGSVRSLLVCARQLLVREVEHACCEFIADRLCLENIFEVRDFACQLKCTKLIEDTEYFMQENFRKVCQTEGFLNAPLCLIKQMTSKDDLLVASEEEVFEAIMRWIKNDPEGRKNHLPDLLRNVRMPLLDLLYLRKHVAQEELISASIPCRNLLDEARDYHLLPEIRDEICHFSVDPRTCLKSGHLTEENSEMYRLRAEVVFSVHSFNKHDKKWFKVSHSSFDVNDSSVVGSGSKMYLLQNGETNVFDTANKKFVFGEKNKFPKFFTGAASLNSKLYLCGGTDGISCSNEVECLDEETGEWTKLSCMHFCRRNLAVVALGKYIYVLGGKGESLTYDSVERYDTNTGKWNTVAPMNTKRWDHGAAVLNNKIYVCGGRTKSKYVATSEIYDPIKDHWECISSMNFARGCFTLLAHCGKLYALGGVNSEGHDSQTVEIYDPDTDKWEFGENTEFVSGAAVVSSKVQTGCV